MTILLQILLLVVGLVILIFAGDFLVRGAANIAYKAKLSPLVVGLTIVAFGTSAPELVVSLSSVYNNAPDIAMGNVIGSNICNLTLVMGATALVYPIYVTTASIKIDWIITFGSGLLLYFFVSESEMVVVNGEELHLHLLKRFEGIILFLILIIYTYFLIETSRKEAFEKEAKGLPIADEEDMEEVEKALNSKTIVEVGFILLGCIGLYFGGNLFVDNVKALAQNMGMTENMAGATVVAFGTSAPELVTSIIAARKKNTDLALGNLLGSCIFNVLSILGITSMIQSVQVAQDLIEKDMLIMLGVVLILLPMMITRKKISALEGFMLLFIYVGYISFKVLEQLNYFT